MAESEVTMAVKRGRGVFWDIMRACNERIRKFKFAEIVFRAGTPPWQRNQKRKKKIQRVVSTMSAIKRNMD